MKQIVPLTLALLLTLTACSPEQAQVTATPAPTPTATEATTPGPTPTPTPEPPVETEASKTLWGFPIDDTHYAFEVPTGGKLGTVLVTVECREREDINEEDEWDWLLSLEADFSVWSADDLSAPLQTMTKRTEIPGGQHDVVDANFDGYMDFGWLYFLGNQPNYWYYWIWDEARGLFVEESAFSVDEKGEAVGGICGPYFDPETETVLGWARYGWAGALGVGTVHRWEEGHLVCMRRIISDPSGESEERVVLIVEERVDGELQEIFRQTYSLGPNGEELFEEREKWYDLNYHGGEEKPALWKEAYINYIQSVAEPGYPSSFSLIYLDDDATPELFHSTEVEAGGEIVATFYDGELRTWQLARIGSLYMEGTGLVYSNNGHMGFYPAEIIKLERGEFTVLGSGLWTAEYPDGVEVDTYEWEGEPMSEAEYYAHIDALFDRKRGTRPEKWYSPTEMLEYLGAEVPPAAG